LRARGCPCRFPFYQSFSRQVQHRGKLIGQLSFPEAVGYLVTDTLENGSTNIANSSHPTATGAAASALAPLQLHRTLRLTPEQFALMCEANPEAVLELAADGQLITMTPTGGETGARNSNLGLATGSLGPLPGRLESVRQLQRLPPARWLAAQPDAAVLSLAPWQAQALTPEQRRGLPPLCPELVIELASASDAGPMAAMPCAASWPPTAPMAPGWAGCCSRRRGRWRSGRGPLPTPHTGNGHHLLVTPIDWKQQAAVGEEVNVSSSRHSLVIPIISATQPGENL
jgi:hypothetical protein